MNYFKARYLRFWKSYAKRTRRFRLYSHYFHNNMLLDMSEPTSREIFAGYEFEYSEYDFVTQSLKEEPCDVFFDVGANWGGYSLLAARAGAKRVEAFEANSKAFCTLTANILLNNFHNQIRAWNIAAGSEDTTGFLSIDPRATDVSTLSPQLMPGKWNYTEKQECLIRRIDTFMPVEGKSVFVKMDVEGHEIEVLRGLEGIIRKNKVRLLVEAFGQSEFETVAKNVLSLKIRKRFGSNIFLTNF